MKPFRQIMMGVVILIIAGCTTQFRNQGYIPTEEEISALVVGVDTRDSVFEALGTPDNLWRVARGSGVLRALSV